MRDGHRVLPRNDVMSPTGVPIHRSRPGGLLMGGYSELGGPSFHWELQIIRVL